MTRINVGIAVSKLTDQHLLAEHREITRIPNVNKGKSITNTIPKHFKLGKGHVMFFYDKIGYLYNRYIELYKECLNRGFNIDSKESTFNGHNLTINWEADIDCRAILIERISNRIYDSKQIPRYYGKPVTKEEAINLLK